MGVIDKRYGYYNDCYYGDCTTSSWSRWIRWLVLGLVILFAIAVFFLFSCFTARRRRKMGYQPYRGTGWALGRTPPGHGVAQPYYGAQQETSQPQTQQPYYNNSNNPPPEYNPAPNTGNQGYYGDSGVTQPSPTYGGQGYEGQFAPPKGPPPGHRADGVIR